LRFAGGELRIEMDEACRFAEGGHVLDELRHEAQARVTSPELVYRVGEDGHLAPLDEVASFAGTEASARALLATPRADFPLGAEVKLVMRAPRGEAYAAGLIRADAQLPPGASVRASVAAQAEDPSGQAAAGAAREVEARAGSDGSFVAAWGLLLKPGRHKVSVAALIPEPGRGSTSTIELEVPDFAAGSLVVSPLTLYPDEPGPTGAADPGDPYAAMRLGPLRIRPRLGNVFTTKDALMVVAALYGAKLDAATGEAVLRALYSILKDGKPVARGAPETFRTSDAVASVGPIALSDFAPGPYVVRLEVTDAVSSQTLRHEAAFEIRAEGGTP
jgi:hypothetical protein